MHKWIFLILCLLSFELSSQDDLQFVPDSTDVDIREFDVQLVDAYNKDRAYNYGQNPKYESNFLRRLWYIFLEKLEEVLGRDGRSLVWNLLWYGLAIAGLIYFIYFLLKKEGTGLFLRAERSIDSPILELLSKETDLSQFDQWIQEAIQENQYRLAIRLYFLKCLKTLDHHDQIEWKAFKTNSDYIKELKSKDFHPDFRDLSFSYEYIWYGEFDPSPEEFSMIEQEFQQFFHRINSSQLI